MNTSEFVSPESTYLLVNTTTLATDLLLSSTETDENNASAITNKLLPFDDTGGGDDNALAYIICYSMFIAVKVWSFRML